MRGSAAPVLFGAVAIGALALAFRKGDSGSSKKNGGRGAFGVPQHGQRATGWTEDEAGWRSWFRGGASWRLNDQGKYEAKRPDGSAITIPDWPAVARKTVSTLLPSLEGVTSDPWYTQALLSIAAHETGGAPLPIYGDYRPGGDITKKPVPPGTKGAVPLSVGYYQFLRSTVDAMGFSWDELAQDPAANHTAALRLAKSTEDIHRQDFPTLAALWGAGRVEERFSNHDWGIVSFRPGTITEFLSAWNSVGSELELRQRGETGPVA